LVFKKLSVQCVFKNLRLLKILITVLHHTKRIALAFKKLNEVSIKLAYINWRIYGPLTQLTVQW